MSDEQSVEERFESILSNENSEEPSDPVQAGQTETEEELEADGEQLEASEESDAEIEIDEPEETESASDYIEFQDTNGETVTVTPEEYRNGYLRQKDFTQKTQKLAQDRTILEEDVKKIEAYYTQRLSELDMFQEPSPDFDELYDQDPLNAPKIERDWNLKQQKRYQLMESQRQQQEKQFLEKQTKGAHELPNQIPEFADPVVRSQSMVELKNSLLDEGFTPDEINSVVDARHIKLLWYGLQYKKSNKNTAQIVAKKVVNKPRVMRPGSAKQKPSKANRSAKRIDVARNSQSKEAWTDVFKDILNDP